MFGFIPKRTVSAKYEALENESEKGRDSSSLFSEDLSPNTKTRWRFIQLLPWLISATLATLSLYQFLSSRPHPLGTFDSGWKTDFAPARPWVAVEQVKFTGSPAFTENTTYWVPNPGPKKYVGNPSAEIDANWDAITWGRYILITEQEARGAFTEQYGDDLSKFWSPIHGGYYVGLDMFHTLHCLNRLRKAFHPDYYPEDDHPNHRMHRDHCFEQIRQYIQCSGDMTPVPTVYNEIRGSNYVDSDVKHTCRNFESMREWVGERYNGSTAVTPVCPKGIYRASDNVLCNK